MLPLLCTSLSLSSGSLFSPPSDPASTHSLQPSFPSLPLPRIPHPLRHSTIIYILLWLICLCWRLCWAQAQSYFRLLMGLGTPGGRLNSTFPALPCRSTASLFLPITVTSDTFHWYWALGKTAQHSTHVSMELFFHKREIYWGNGSTITLLSQLEPAMEIWAKAEAKCARTAWERSIESLGI